ncbi:helix-turn-helix transcriptional regulator [Paenibacillus sp. NFR01]|uniref:helix-turn-helix domain-containing protein n=1 Tax=Paenibacillus sp. NFR01 TaxID=1566279 RepID=UPI0008D151A8|nr:helix-turn-helix transcriptional regulator [Paenibacillus sp. NFR01]SEU27338.1 hypothetical protein SAMN03159358_4557 [Paenibacillus sp. NFR01]
MDHTTTIRTELKDFIGRERLSFSQLGQKAGLNAGTVSSILKGSRVMSVDQLDRMTAVLGYPEGFFYDEYLRECMVDTVPNWRRVKPFVLRCAELDKLDCIRRMVQMLLDNLMYSPLLFEVAEVFFSEGKKEAAEVLYTGVAASERRQHSERLAFCQYRLFSLRLGQDPSANLQAALQFEPYVDRLDEVDQLDALKDLANTYHLLRRWDKVDRIAEELAYKAKIQLLLTNQTGRKRQEPRKQPEYPLFSYLAISNLLRANVCDERGDHGVALQWVDISTELSLAEEDHQETAYWVGLFMDWAQSSTYVTKLMSGDDSVLWDYVAHIEARIENLPIGLLHIIRAANQYGMNVDSILQYFEKDLADLSDNLVTGVKYTEQLINDRCANMMYEMARYHFSRQRHVQGLVCLTNALTKYASLNDNACMLRCVRLFEQYRDYATPEAVQEYRSIMDLMPV